MPAMLLLVGLPGSGKSTWLKEHAKEFEDHHIVSLDNVIIELGERDGLSYDESWDKNLKEANKIMNARFKQAVNEGKHIVVDKTNLTVKSRAKTMRQAPGYMYSSITFECEDDVLNNRLDERAKKTGKTIPQYVMENFRQSIVPPTPDEGFEICYTLQDGRVTSFKADKSYNRVDHK